MKQNAITSDSKLAQDKICIRMTPSRKANLAALSSDLPSSSRTPTDVIDHAISIALTIRRSRGLESEVRFNDLDNAMELLAADRQKDARDHGTMLNEISQSIRDMRDLMSAVASLPGSDDGNFSEKAPPLKDWLDKEAQYLPQKTMLVRARWQAMTRVGEHSISIELRVERVASAGQARGAKPGAPGLANIDHIESGSSLARLELIADFYLACQNNGNGWLVNAHQIQPDRTIGPLVGAVRA